MIQKICHWILSISSIVAVMFIGILASLPPICRDSLTHHLYVPKLYLKAGSIYEIPHIPFSYYPQLLEMLYIVPLYFNNDIIPKYIHFSFAILTAFFIYSYLKVRVNKLAGVAAFLFFLTIPVIVKLSITVYVDLGLICFNFISIFYLFKWKNSGLKWRYLIISGFFTGLAMGTKYNGILSLIILTLILPMLTVEHEQNYKELNRQHSNIIKPLLYSAVFAIAALLIFSPWMIRNYLWTSSPLYPLYTTKINSANQSETELSLQGIEENNVIEGEKNINMNHFLIRKYVFKEKWWETLSIPIRIFFQGEDDNPALFDGKLNPFLFMMPLLFLLLIVTDKQNSLHLYSKNRLSCPKNDEIDNLQTVTTIPDFNVNNKLIDREAIFLLLFSALFVLLVFLKSDMRIRYVSPIIPPLVIVFIIALYRVKAYVEAKLSAKTVSAGIVSDIAIKLRRLIILSIIPVIYCVAISIHFPYCKALFLHYDPTNYIFSKVSRSEYINRFRPEYELIEYLNGTSDPNYKILAIFLGNRGYYFDNDVVFNTNFLLDTVKAGHEGTNIANKLKKNGFTHLIINYNLFSQSILNNLSTEQQQEIKVFFVKNTTLIKQNSFYGLYMIR